MKHIIIPLSSLLCWVCLLAPRLQAQSTAPEVLASTGGDSPQVSWTAGEAVVSTHASGSILLTQGFHQPNLVVTSIDEPIDVRPAAEITVFPNPVSDQLNVRIENASGTIQFTVFDVQGKLLIQETEALSNGTYSYDFSSFSSGSYFLRAVDEAGNSFKTFKILKRN